MLTNPFLLLLVLIGILLFCIVYHSFAKKDFRVIGTLIGSLGLLFVAAGGGLGIPVVLNNTQLGWLSTTQSLPVWRLGFSTPGDGGAAIYTSSNVACTLNAGAGDNGSQVQSSDGKCWIAAFPGQVDVRVFGAKCDDAANDTTPLQNAINAAKGSGTLTGSSRLALLVKGTCQVTGTTIDRPITIAGTGEQDATIKLRAGSVAPAFSISCAWDTVDYYATNSTTCDVIFRHLRVVSDNRADAPGQAVAHGFEMHDNATNEEYTRVVMEDVRCNAVPGDCVHGTPPWHGWVEANDFAFWAPGGYGVYANSVTDWQMHGGTIDNAVLDNFLCSGCSGFTLSQVYMFAAQRYNLNLFGAIDHFSCDGCYFDIAAQHGVYANMSAAGRAVFINSYFRWNGQAVADAYGDIFMPNAAAGRVELIGVHFAGSPNPFGGTLPLWNIYFDTANATSLTFDAATKFDYGIGGFNARTINNMARVTPPGVIYKDLASTVALTPNTYYFGAAGVQTAAVGAWSTPKQCVALGFTLVTTAFPGAGQSYTATLVRNGTDTAMTGTISGASANTLEVNSNVVLFNQFDTFMLKDVVSAAAAGGLHTGTLRMYCP
jgi:hypothetical protein